MERLAPYSGIVLALVVGVLLAVSLGRTTAPSESPTATSTASSTLGVVGNIAFPSLSVPAIPAHSAGTSTVAKDSARSTAPEDKGATPKPAPQGGSEGPVVPSEPAQPAPAPTPAPTKTPSSGNAALDSAASTLRAALVNIICLAPSGSGIRSISASGVVVDDKGVVLTNAHVGQYFLLADRGVQCSIRTGSPARDAYRAALMYIPSTWIDANASLITQSAPSGTGENDFALLALTSAADGSAVPAPIPSVPLATVPPASGEAVVIGSYGAQFLDYNSIVSSLNPTIAFGSVKKEYTFGGNTVDELSLGGSAAAQEGSSGGGIVSASGKLVALITTSTISGDTASRNLGAITASYIRARYASATGEALDLLLSRSPAQAAADFAPQMPALEKKITDALAAVP